MLDPVKWREDPLLCECAVCCRLLVCLLSGVTSHPHVPLRAEVLVIEAAGC